MSSRPSGLGSIWNIWATTIVGALIWWCVGLNLFVFHLVALALFFKMCHRNFRVGRGIYVPQTFVFLLAVTVTYLFSILLHGSSAPGSRVIAAFYNLSFYIMSLLLILTFANAFAIQQIPVIYKAIFRVSWVSGIAVLVVCVAWGVGVRSIILETPLYPVLRHLDPTPLGLVENSLLIKPLFLDWFASVSRPRFNIFSPYATASGAVITTFILILITDASRSKKLFNPLFVSLIFLNLFALVMTLSRGSILAFFVSFLIIFLLQRRNAWLWILLAGLILVLASPWLLSFMGFLLDLRESSTMGRLDLYMTSLSTLGTQDWVVGFGIKPRTLTSVIPMGSHSTFLSLVFKTGVVGAVSFILFQVSLFLSWIRLRNHVAENRDYYLFWRGLGWVFVSMAIWMLVDDIDAPQFLAFLYFSLVGIFEGFRRHVLAEESS